MDNFVLEKIFNEDATLSDLCFLVGMLATLIYVVFALFDPILLKLAKGPLNQRFEKIAELEFNRPDKLQEQGWFGLTTKEEYCEFIKGFWSAWILISCQHLVGGFCTLPSVTGLGNFSESVATSLACLGIMIEMGWEVQDFINMFVHRVFLGEKGKKRYPDAFVIIFTLHHSLTCSMALPTILNYRSLPELHRMCADLQFAGAFVMLLSDACRALDVSKRNELWRFLFFTFLMLLLTLWARVIDWFYLSYKLLGQFYADGKTTFLVVGSIAVTAMSLFNLFVMTIPTVLRMIKFLKKLKEFESLPQDVDEQKRRSTVFDLRIAAAEMAAIETRADESAMNLYQELFPSTEKVERRHTVGSALLARATHVVSDDDDSSNLYRPQRSSFRRSMIAWRGLPSREMARTKRKND